MLHRNFPEEERYLLKRPEAVERVVRRVYRWDARLLHGIASLLGRPVYRFFVIEAEGRPAATALLTFGPVSGYVSTVMVDVPFRRRGYARRLLAACTEAARRARRRFIVLDVLTTNEPALALYRDLGFAPLRPLRFLVREIRPGEAGSLAEGPNGVRPIGRADGKGLAELLRRNTPAEVAEALPVSARQFFVSTIGESLFAGETEAWVSGPPGAPTGFVRATVDATSEAGHLAAPLFGPALTDAEVDRWLAGTVGWFARHGATRVVVEVPEHAPRALDALGRAGFTEALRLVTLRLPLVGA